MGKRKGKNRNTGIRSWGVLGALWLVLFCLVGCKVSGSGGGAGIEGNRAVQASSLETEISEAENRGIGNGITEAGTIDAAKPETGKLETEGPAAQQTETENGNTEPEETKAENAEAGEPENEQIKAGETADGMPKTDGSEKKDEAVEAKEEGEPIEEDGVYTSKDEVAAYLHIYGRLPQNYITKKEAEKAGWDSRKGNLWEVAPGMSIGGSHFGNYEGALPDKKGRKYYECDIDYDGGYRGAKRLIYSSDGLIFYTEDHYNTFEQLYSQ